MGFGIVKKVTGYCPVCDEKNRFPIPDWADHPSWITGVRALEEFHRWVSCVVLPIAFQWIEEHYDEVYDKVPKREGNQDDVGVVIAAAFELIRSKHKKAYEKGLDRHQTFKKGLEDSSFDSSTINPVWTRITSQVTKATREIFESEKKYLDDTI